MPGISKNLEEKPKPYGPPMWLPIRMQPGTGNLLVGFQEQSEFSFSDCPCQDCNTFFVTEPEPVNNDHEEDRQEKLRVEREAAAAAVEASKKDDASKDQPQQKND